MVQTSLAPRPSPTHSQEVHSLWRKGCQVAEGPHPSFCEQEDRHHLKTLPSLELCTLSVNKFTIVHCQNPISVSLGCCLKYGRTWRRFKLILIDPVDCHQSCCLDCHIGHLSGFCFRLAFAEYYLLLIKTMRKKFASFLTGTT